MIPVVRKIVLIGGIIIAVAVIAVAVSMFSVPVNPLTCKAPFAISEGQCLCPGIMVETILDDGSKSCKFQEKLDLPPGPGGTIPEIDCEEFPELCRDSVPLPEK